MSSGCRSDLVLSPLLADQTEPWVTTMRRFARTGASAREAARALDWSERTLRRRMLEAFGYGYTIWHALSKYSEHARFSSGDFRRPMSQRVRVMRISRI